MKRLVVALCLILVVVAFGIVQAEVRRDGITISSVTNTAAQSTTSLPIHGLLWRLTIITAGITDPTATNCVVITDDDGTMIYSNAAATGTITSNFTGNVPCVGMNIQTYKANSNGVTVTVAPTYQK